MATGGELGEVVARARAAREAGQPALLATLVSVRGSSYRRPGARLLIASDTAAAGAVSGGCLERDLVRRGWWRTEDGGPALVTYDSTEDDDDFGPRVGLGCNGVVEILVERLREGWERTAALGFIQRCLAGQVVARLATVFRSRDPGLPPGTWVGLPSDGSAEGPGIAAADLLAAAQAAPIGARSSGVVSLRDDTIEALVETVRPPPHLFVCGAGADVVPLLQQAKSLGWTTTAWDPSPRFETRLRLAMADHRHTGPAAALGAAIERALAPVVVVMTHDAERDREALAMALASRARYVGVLGPRRRTDRLLAGLGLRDAGATLHAPAGLALGAETAAEIALSIVAEIQAVLAGETALPLRDRAGPIHGAIRHDPWEGRCSTVGAWQLRCQEPLATLDLPRLRWAKPSSVHAPAPACAILAAGAGRRYGGPKQLASIDGQPMLRRIAAAACASRCGSVGVVLGAHAELIWPVLADLPVRRIDNPDWDEGMASSIRAAVGWARASGAGALLLAVGDQPGLDTRHLDRLVDAAAGSRVAASRYAGVLGPPALFPADWFPRLQSLQGDVGARALLRDSHADVVVVDWPAGAADLDLRRATETTS